MKAILTTVKESIEYFSKNLLIDIIFATFSFLMDYHLKFLMKQKIKIPVIFITGYDKFILYAFENNGIDYLLKPVNKEDIARSIFKYKMLENISRANNQSAI